MCLKTKILLELSEEVKDLSSMEQLIVMEQYQVLWYLIESFRESKKNQ